MSINIAPFFWTLNGILYLISRGIRAIDAKENRKNNLTETSPYGPRIFALVQEYPQVTIASTIIIVNFNSFLFNTLTR